MKVFSTLLMLLPALMLLTSSARADWATNLTTEPPAGTAVPTSIRPGGTTEYFFWIDAESTNASSYIFLQAGANVDICLDSDTTHATAGNGSLEVNVLHKPYYTGGEPAGLLDVSPLLGITLDGVASTSGTTNDCIYDVKGPMWFKINVVAASAAEDLGLVSVSPRPF